MKTKLMYLLMAIALISCKEEIEVNHDCLSNKYECASTFTIGTTTTLICKGCLTETLTCKSCGNTTIIPTFTLDVTGEVSSNIDYGILLDSALFYHMRSISGRKDSFDYYNKRLKRLANLKQ